MFQRNLKILLAVCLAASAVGATITASAAMAADSPFIGEWKLDSSKSRMPDEMKVESKGGNKYAFDFGGGVETIVADGTFQPGLDGTRLNPKHPTLGSSRARRTVTSCSGRRGSSPATAAR